MTMLEAIAKVKSGVWQFIRLVFSANRDLPFYDYDEEEWEYTQDGDGI